MNKLEGLQRALKAAEEVLAILELQAAGYTELTIPVHLKLDLEKKREEVKNYKEQIADIENTLSESKSYEAISNKAEILSLDGIDLFVDLIVASHSVENPVERRKMLITVGNNPDEYQLSGVGSVEFAKILIHRLNQNGDRNTLEKILDEIAKLLHPSLINKIHQIRTMLINSPKEIILSDTKQPPVPTLEEVQNYINNFTAKVLETHVQFLDGIGYYFLQREPVELEDDYIKAVEKLLTVLEFHGYQSKWSVDLQNIILDALCLAGALANTIKKHPNDARGKDFIKDAKELGKVLNRLHWRNWL